MAAASRVTQDLELVAQLQTEAARNPRLYRLRLAVIAIAGDFALMTAQVAPWAAPIIIGVLWTNVAAFYWLGGAAVLFLVWLLRPSFRFSGRKLVPSEAPLLYQELGLLKQKLQVSTRMDVYLDAELNASAAETRGLFGIFGTRTALTLGVPLLRTLDREEALAVIAHEFGHFSRRHGRLGNWLYRARVGWLAYAEQVTESDSTFDQAAAWYAKRFVPFFSLRTFVHSRQCEYEADADAAHAVGSGTVADALTRLSVLGRVWSERLPRELADWQLRMQSPPEDFHERFARLCNECSSADRQSFLDQELAAPSGWHDTHPSLSERLASLKEAPRLKGSASNAGEELLGKAWPNVLAEFNASWARKMRADWLLEHLRAKHVTHPLLSADAAAMEGWNDEQRLARARALRAADPAAGLAALGELHKRKPAHQRTTFAYAAALLSESDQAGVQLMETLAREAPAFRAQAFARVASYFERKGDRAQAERWSVWLKRAEENLTSAISAFVHAAEAGQARPSSLPGAIKAAIEEATELDPCIEQGWLVEGIAQLTFAQDRQPVPVTMHLLALAIDPESARREEQDEEQIGNRYRDFLQRLVPADEGAIVRTYFTTEPLPPAFQPGNP
jgi:Zn-dependent protease with chaperone function